MFIHAVALALAVAAPASAADMTAQRREEITLAASNWTEYRNKATRMMTSFPDAAVKVGYGRNEMDNLMLKVSILLNDVENTERKAADLALEDVRKSSACPERLAREKAVAALFEVRALTLYANMLPRILDEAITDEKDPKVYLGHRYAGAEWAVTLSFEECGEASRALRAKAGYTEEQYKVFQDDARKYLGLPPAVDDEKKS